MSASASELLRLLRDSGLRVFTSADLQTLAGLKGAAATQALRRLAARDLVLRIKRGTWVNRLAPGISPYEAVPHLRAPWPAYVSLYSALADHGVIDELPHAVYAVSPAQPKRLLTPIGEFRFHYLPPRMIWGFEFRRVARGGYPIADREKAFLDLVYLALSRRSPIGLPRKRGRRWALDKRRLGAYAERLDTPAVASWLRAEGLI